MTKEQILEEAKKRYPSGTLIQGLPYAYDEKEKSKGTVNWEEHKNYKYEPIFFDDYAGKKRLFLGVSGGTYRILIYDDQEWAKAPFFDKLIEARKIIYQD